MNKTLKIFLITLILTVAIGGTATVLAWLNAQKIVADVTEDITVDEGEIQVEEVTAKYDSIVEIEPIPTPTPPPFEDYEISIMAVGDNLMHQRVISVGQQPDGSYDFHFLFEPVKAYVETADVSIINQETIMAGNEKGFSGYPYFNSPVELAQAINDVGFDVVLQATNHTYDMGMAGMMNACQVWKQYPNITMVGMHEDSANERDIPIIEVKDRKIAVLNYTYGPNLGAVPGELKGKLNVLCAIKPGSSYNEIDLTELNPNVTEDIAKAKEMADFVIVCPHWGNEYQTTPSSYQVKFAKQMVEAGADLIIGAHPHVPEPVEWVETDNGNKGLCYYSLGNYVSTQQQGESMLEEMAWVVLHVSEDEVYIDENKTGVVPMVMHYRTGPLRYENIYMLDDYNEELCKQHGIAGWGGVTLTMDKLNRWCEEIIGQWRLDKNFMLNQ